MATESYDVLILGGGNAGFGVTVPTRKAGMKVAVVEERNLGGTCPNSGCTPKKVLVAAGLALHEINQAHVHKISVSKPKLDWAQVEKHRRWVQQSRGEMALKADKGMKINVIEGFGEFVDAHTLKVTAPDGAVRRTRGGGPGTSRPRFTKVQAKVFTPITQMWRMRSVGTRSTRFRS